jgi:hypothetical protein
MSVPVDDLIDRLGADLRPVRRLRSPWIRAGFWLSGVAALALALASIAKLGAIEHRLMAVPDMWAATLGAAATMILAAVATFQLSLPDRRPAWALLPAPGLMLWIGASGLGCLRSWVIPGMQPATMHDADGCFTFIVGLSIPLSILTVLMIRRACPLRPNLTAATGGLAVAAAAATLLTFFHPHDASAIDLAMHALAVTLVVCANRLLGGWLLTPRISFRRP